jgi:NADH dehydrogenase
VRNIHISGLVAWVAWLGIHLIFLIGLRNKLAVMLQWMYSYFAYKRGARIIPSASSEKRTSP